MSLLSSEKFAKFTAKSFKNHKTQNVSISQAETEKAEKYQNVALLFKLDSTKFH
jgi:hypothetical protein